MFTLYLKGGHCEGRTGNSHVNVNGLLWQISEKAAPDHPEAKTASSNECGCVHCVHLISQGDGHSRLQWEQQFEALLVQDLGAGTQAPRELNHKNASGYGNPVCASHLAQR